MYGSDGPGGDSGVPGGGSGGPGGGSGGPRAIVPRPTLPSLTSGSSKARVKLLWRLVGAPLEPQKLLYITLQET